MENGIVGQEKQAFSYLRIFSLLFFSICAVSIAISISVGLYQSITGLEIVVFGWAAPTFLATRVQWALAWFCLGGSISALAFLSSSREVAFAFLGVGSMFLALGAFMSLSFGLFDSQWGFEHLLIALLGWAGLLVYQAARLKLVWERLRPVILSRRALNEEQRAIKERGFGEHLLYLSISLLLLVLAASNSSWSDLSLMDRQANGEHLLPALVFTIYIASAFFPLLTAFWLFERARTIANNERFWRNDVVTPFILGVILTGLAGVSALAFFAARHVSSEISAAISYSTFLGVFCLFLIVIALPHLLSVYHKRKERSISEAALPPPLPAGVASLEAPARWISRLDTLLVKIVAPLSGGTQALFAHAHVIAILSLLSILGLVIPRPYGLLPILLGILLAVSLGRRWAWIEEDRETASRLERTSGPNIHLGFENDLKDEALLGYAGLFVLVPLTLYQIQDITLFTPPLEEQRGILLTWVVFFGGELAKAVPFVDWWDIYGNSDLSETGKHLTFVSRAAVDLVILSALFQALNIWQRNRVQTRLYEEGHLDSFDPFKEREFFEQGVVRLNGDFPSDELSGKQLAKAERFAARLELLRAENRLAVERLNDGTKAYFMLRKKTVGRISKHVAERTKLLNQSAQSFETASPYSRRRLSELSRSSNCDLKAGANWMISRWDVLVGTPIQQLHQLARRWERTNYPLNVQGADAKSRKLRRVQKVEFERVLVELADSRWVTAIRREDVSALSACLKRISMDVEFDFSRILSFEIFAFLKTEYAVLYLSKFVVRHQDLRQNDRWRHKLLVLAEGADHSMYARRGDMRLRVYDAAARIALNANAGDAARQRATELLEWMSTDDRADNAREHASRLAKRARSQLNLLTVDKA